MPHPRWIPPNVPFTAALAGVSRKGLYASVHRGDTKPLLPGTFIASSAWPEDPIQQHLVMALARQLRWQHLVASHYTAALADGSPLLNSVKAAADPPWFSRDPGPGVRSSRHPNVVVRELPRNAVTAIPDGTARGLQLTTPARTALDLACELPLPEALMLTDHVARQSLMELAGLRGLRRLEQDLAGSRSPRNGDLSLAQRQAALRPLELAVVSPVHRSPEVRRVLQLTDPMRESPPESKSHGEFVLAGLPIPECQVRFRLGPDNEVRVDFYWPQFGLVGECDGNVKYDGTLGPADEAMVGQNMREQALRDLGLIVVRWTAKEILFTPHVVIERVAARLYACGWDGRLVR